MSKRPLPTIGVDKYTFFELISDTAEGVAYGAAVSVPGTVQISPTDSAGTDTFNADNGIYEVESYIERMGHEIENADITPEIDALWRGIEKINGAVVVGNKTATKYFGAAWRILKTDGTYRYVKYFKGTYSFASNVGGKTKASGGASDKQTAKATFTAVQRDYDDGVYMYVDQADVALGDEFEDISEFENAWFNDMATLTGDDKIVTATEV
jgi:phi13 family phage major tail protein